MKKIILVSLMLLMSASAWAGTYEVWAGNENFMSESNWYDYYYNINSHGYEKLGSDSESARFCGNYNYAYYTNSTHLPVGYTDDIFEVLEHQDPLQRQYSGGTVLHIFTGESFSPDMIPAVKNLVKKVSHNYTLPYFTITPTFSICPNHNYISGEHPECPKCGEECEVYSRVVGYYRPVSSWNIGKQKEFEDRKYFKIED